MDIILIPGLWLTARSWDDVVPRLEEGGHTAHALTLPGMESVDADRSAVTRQQHVDAAIAAIDAVAGDAKVLLVGTVAAVAGIYPTLYAMTAVGIVSSLAVFAIPSVRHLPRGSALTASSG